MPSAWLLRPRFTTKLLLVFMVLFGAILVPFVWRLDKARKQRELVEEIQRRGGTVTYSWENSGSPPADTKLRQLLGEDFFDEVSRLDFPCFEMVLCPQCYSDEFEAQYPEDSLIQGSTVHNHCFYYLIDDAGNKPPDLTNIRTFRGLRVLRLSGTPTADISPLAELHNLIDVDISYSEVRDLCVSTIFKAVLVRMFEGQRDG